MKKSILLVLGLAMIVGCTTGCGGKAEAESAPATEATAEAEETTAPEEETAEEESAEEDTTAETADASDFMTYEFETFDGDTVVIDSANIVSQESDENPFESALVPADAEQIAPGRDYVYLADASYYYVEDAVNNLVTIANKDEAADADSSAADSASADEVFENDDFSISYTPGLFEAAEVRGFVRIPYVNEEIQFAGSNEINITKDEGATVDEIIQAIAGDEADAVSEGSLGVDAIPTKNFTRTSESPADSSLTLVESFMVMQHGDDVITVDVIRTVGQDDETDMTIEGAFTHTLESFVLK